MAVEPGLDPPKDKVEVWDTAKGRPAQGFTLYQAMGMSGGDLVEHQGGAAAGVHRGARRVPGEWACAYLPSTLNMVANSMFDLAKLITAGTISFRSLAANPQLVVNLFDQAVAPVNQISTQLFLGMSVVMVMLTGAYVVLTGGALRNRNRQRETLQALLGGGRVHADRHVPGDSVDPAQRAQTELLLADHVGAEHHQFRQSGAGLDAAAEDLECVLQFRRCPAYLRLSAVPEHGLRAVGERAVRHRPGRADAVRSDGLAKFGATVDGGVIPTAEQGQSDLRLVQLWTQGGYTASEVAHGPRPAGNPQDLANAKPEERQGQWNAVREVMWTHYNPHYPTWQGGANAGGERVNLAFFALLLSILVGGAFVVVTSALLLLWNCVLVVLFFFLPILALAGLFPPTQRIFRTWLTTWLKALG